MKLILVTTFINFDNITNLISSIEPISEINISLIIVNQTRFSITINERDKNKFFHFKEIFSSQKNSSEARNIGIKYLFEQGITFDYIMFPDDDSTFSKGFFKNLSKSLLRPEANYLIPIYCTDSTKKLYKKFPFEDGELLVKRNWKYVGAVNQIINYQSIREVKGFNINFGIGSKYGGAEDVDLFLRILKSGNTFIASSIIFNFHPSGDFKHNNLSLVKLTIRFIKYGKGTAKVLQVHKLYFDHLIYTFRPWFGFLLYFIKFKFKLSFAYLFSFIYRLINFLYVPVENLKKPKK